MTNLEFLAKALEISDNNITSVFSCNCNVCPLRGRCTKETMEDSEDSCEEFLVKVLGE